MRLLLIDNYDSFTYNLFDYFARLGAHCEIWRNDAPQYEELLQRPCDAVVFSPGPGRPQEAGWLMRYLDFVVQKELPLLGVCLGHQAIGEYFGAELLRAKHPMHGKCSPLLHCERDIFEGIEQGVEVMRYHSLLLEKLPEVLEVLGQSPQGELMALRHKTSPIWGLQFHPESILSPQGLPMLQNFLDLAKAQARVQGSF